MGSNPTESFGWAVVPQVCSDLPRNREQPGVAYGSLALKVLYFLVCKHRDRIAILTYLKSSLVQYAKMVIYERESLMLLQVVIQAECLLCFPSLAELWQASLHSRIHTKYSHVESIACGCRSCPLFKQCTDLHLQEYLMR